MPRAFDYLYIAIAIGLTSYSQLALKWRISSFGPLPAGALEKLKFLMALLFDPIIFSGFVAAFLAALAWMAAMTKFDLSHAYSFTGLNFILVLMLSGWALHEPVTCQKVIGIGLIALGTLIAAYG